MSGFSWWASCFQGPSVLSCQCLSPLRGWVIFQPWMEPVLLNWLTDNWGYEEPCCCAHWWTVSVSVYLSGPVYFCRTISEKWEETPLWLALPSLVVQAHTYPWSREMLRGRFLQRQSLLPGENHPSSPPPRLPDSASLRHMRMRILPVFASALNLFHCKP